MATCQVGCIANGHKPPADSEKMVLMSLACRTCGWLYHALCADCYEKFSVALPDDDGDPHQIVLLRWGWPPDLLVALDNRQPSCDAIDKRWFETFGCPKRPIAEITAECRQCGTTTIKACQRCLTAVLEDSLDARDFLATDHTHKLAVLLEVRPCL